MAVRVPDITSRIRVDTTGLDTAERRTTRFSSTVGSALKFAGAAAIGGALVKFGKDSLKAYTDAEAGVARFNAVAANTPELNGATAASFAELNTALAKKTKFDDDAILSGQAVLANFGLTEEQLRKLTPLLLDYAERTGKDLPTAAQDLGKATLGQGRALAAVGVKFQDTGTKAGNLASITDILSSKIGGLAEAAGTTTAGKMAILSNQFGELKEDVGAALVPALISATSGLLDFVDVIRNADDVAEDFGNFIEDNQTAVTLLGSALTASAIPSMVRFADLAQTSVRVKLAEWFADLKDKASQAGGGIGIAKTALAGLSATAAIAVVAAIVNEFRIAKQEAEEFAQSVTAEADFSSVSGHRDAVADLRREYEESIAVFDDVQSRHEGFGGALKAIAGVLPGVHDEVGTTTQAVIALDKALQDAEAESMEFANNLSWTAQIAGVTEKQAKILADRIGVDLNDNWSDLVGPVTEAAAALGTTTAAEDEAAGATAVLADKVATAEERVTAFRKSLQALFDDTFNVEEATSAWEESVDNLTAGLEKNGKTLDLSTDKGRENRANIRDLVAATQDRVAAEFEATNSTIAANKVADEQREALRGVLEQTNLTKGEIRSLIDTVKDLPPGASTKIDADITEAEAALNRLTSSFQDRRINMRATVTIPAMPGTISGGVTYVHTGGMVTPSWPRTPGLKSDERMAVLQTGEEVVPRGGKHSSSRSAVGLHIEHFHAEPQADPKQLASALAWELG